MERIKGMLQVLVKKDNREFFDYVKKSRLTHLIRTGYVTGIPMLLKGKEKLSYSTEGIIVTFDNNKKISKFQVQ